MDQEKPPFSSLDQGEEDEENHLAGTNSMPTRPISKESGITKGSFLSDPSLQRVQQPSAGVSHYTVNLFETLLGVVWWTHSTSKLQQIVGFNDACCVWAKWCGIVLGDTCPELTMTSL